MQQNRASQPIAGPELKQRQIAFLDRIRDVDPKRRVEGQAQRPKRTRLMLDRSLEMDTTAELRRMLLVQSVGRMQLGYGHLLDC